MDINKLERKFGKYAIKNLSLYIIGAYVLGYLLELLSYQSQTIMLLYFDPYLILHGQIWRLISWVVIPPTGLSIFTLINLYFFFSLGRVLESLWGCFRYNLYIFSGLLFVIVGCFLLYGFGALTGGLGYSQYGAAAFGQLIGQYVSTYYINICVIMAFALTIPDMQVLFMFVIPLKMKWLAYIEGAMLLFDFFRLSAMGKIVMVISLLNFFVFLLLSKNGGVQSARRVRHRIRFEKSISPAREKLSHHKCCVCGRTEEDDPGLVFRYCSKCKGNYEYCQEHLFTHEHIQ